MSDLIQVVFASLLLSLLPAQVKQASSRQAKAISGMSLQTGEACDGLSSAECCGQMLELAGFRSQGDYLSRTIKTTVQLACASEPSASPLAGRVRRTASAGSASMTSSASTTAARTTFAAP